MALEAERLMERISDFRISTEHMRANKAELSKNFAPAAEVKPTENDKKVRNRDKKSKKKKDATMALWCPDANKLDRHEIEVVQKQLAASYRRLDALPDDFKRNGGDRMVGFKERLGGVNEDSLCVNGNNDKQRARFQKKQEMVIRKAKERALGGANVPQLPPALLRQAHGIPAHAQLVGMPQLPQLPPPPPALGDSETSLLLPHNASDAEDNTPPQLPPAAIGRPQDSAAAAAHFLPFVPGLSESEDDH
eukprot:TRINITY_DN86069_c0_g1_i1.p1 TRINITY_DN86069_c0_g1~~TRINITY_DN86069_c0_g1_i1.p1  ORF type:complete len:281 (-),score=70.26 TRINITY_DN86069_c0_g1_i1:56-802(-)